MLPACRKHRDRWGPLDPNMRLLVAGLVVLGILCIIVGGLGQQQRLLSLPAPGAVGLLADGPPQRCFWVFEGYTPSELESAWWRDIAENQEGDVCENLVRKHPDLLDAYVSAVPLLTPHEAPGLGTEGPGHCAQESNYTGLPASVFSRFEYRWRCRATELGWNEASPPVEPRFVYIEPLAGILRHPLACRSLNANLLRRDYMVVDAWASHHATPHAPLLALHSSPRSYYFDAGASTWNTGAGGASQPWFCGVYQERCVRFDDVYAWETRPMDAVQVMKEIPGPIRPRYHWYNVPASPLPDDWDNPLKHILSETTPQDFVVFKLDIDNWRVEEALVRQILDSPALLSRIDEMFWEHHVNFQPMAGCCWGKAVHRDFKQEDSIAMFSALRRAGIRVHSWV